MKARHKLFLFGVIFLFCETMASPLSAKPAAFCRECHSLNDRQNLIQFRSPSPIAESRSVYHAKLDPCPGIRSFSEEVFFTESRVLMLNQILNSLESESSSLKKKIAAIAESFSGLKNQEKISVAQFAQESLFHRTALQKIYDRTLQIREETARRWLIGLSSLLFLGLFALGAVAYRNLDRMGKTLLLFLFLGATFSAGACFYGPKVPEKKTPAQERLEESLAVAVHTSQRMEKSFSQSILLADLAREWAKFEAGPAEGAFQLSWQMAWRAREITRQAEILEEVISQWPDQETARAQGVDFNAALDLRDELRSVKGRTWALRAVAEEWGRAGLPQGRRALEFASQETLKIEDGAIRDQELQPLVEAWVGISEDRAIEISRCIQDPLGKALSLTRVAFATRIQGRAGQLLEEAWKAAELISPSYPPIKAFIRIAACGAQIYPHQKNTWAARVLEKFQGLNPQLQAFSLQEMIFHWAPFDWEQAERWAAEISQNIPTTRAYSLIRIAQTAGVPRTKAHELWKRALAETSKISDSGEALKIRSLIAQGIFVIAPQEALRIIQQVEDPFYRSEILEQLAKEVTHRSKREALELAEKIPWEAFRLRSFLQIANQWILRDSQKAIPLYQEAFRIALTIPDPYARALTLMELEKPWGQIERGKAKKALEAAEKAAEQIASPPLKAEVLERLAESWKGSDPQKAQAILEKVDPAVRQTRQILEEIRLWSRADPRQAKKWAEVFPSTFALEKATAFKEVAGAMKKTDPALALDLLGKALDQALALPEGPKASKLLSQLVAEATLLDDAGTFRRLLQIPDREMKELLLKETGDAWVQQDSPMALKQALRALGEIGEGSLRWALWQKIVEREAQRPSLAKLESRNQPALQAVSYWGQGKGKAKNDESQGVPFYLKALQEMEKVEDLQERSYLLGGLAAEWAPLDEEKALEIAGKISAAFPEPHSYALLQVGTQLRKWNRQKAREVFQKTLAVGGKIQNPALRAQRFLQIAQQWYFLDVQKGQEVLKMAEREARKVILLAGQENKTLAAILRTQSTWEPDQALTIASESSTPYMGAKILLAGAEVFSQRDVGENLKILEKSFSYAQKEKNPRLLGEIAVAWCADDQDKAMDILAQVEPIEVRVQCLLQMARLDTHPRQVENKRLLEQAAQEVLKIDAVGDRIKYLKEIAGAWCTIDKEQAKKIYRQAYQVAASSFPPALILGK